MGQEWIVVFFAVFAIGALIIWGISRLGVKKPTPIFDFLLGLVAVMMLIALTGGWAVLGLFVWAVVDFVRWLSRPREPATHA